MLGWDDGAWLYLPGGMWGSLSVLQAAQCPSSAPLPHCAASGQMLEPGLVQTVFHVIFSERWMKEKIYSLCMCCFNLPLRGWSRTESVVNRNFKKIMRCFSSQAGIQSYFLYSSSSSKKKTLRSSCLWFVHKYNIKHLLCASDVRSKLCATVLIHLEDAWRVSGLAQCGTGEESDSEKGRGNGIIMKDFFPSYCFLLFILLSMFPLVISLPEMKITWQENNVSTPIIFRQGTPGMFFLALLTDGWLFTNIFC